MEYGEDADVFDADSDGVGRELACLSEGEAGLGAETF